MIDIFYYILNFTIILVWAVILYKRSDDVPLKKFFAPALLLKWVVGIGLGLLYLYYYKGGDTFSFYNASLKLTQVARQDFSSYLRFMLGFGAEVISDMPYAYQPRALFVVKILSFLNLLTHNSYWLASLYFSMFSFSGLWALGNALSVLKIRRSAIVISLLLFPSLVFWSSGVIKESLAVGALGFLSASFIQYFIAGKRLSLVAIVDVLMLLILWKVKYYYAGMFLLVTIAGLGTFLLSHRYQKAGRWGMLLGLYLIISLFGFMLVSVLHPNFYLHRILGVIVDNYHAFISISHPGDAITYKGIEPSLTGILPHVPKALWNGLYAPLPWYGPELFKVIAGIENVILILLTVGALAGLRRGLSSKKRILLICVIAYCIGLAIFLALSAPNYGTLVRYKVGFLPFLLILMTTNNPLLEKLNRLVK